MNEKTNQTRIFYIIISVLFIINVASFLLIYFKLNKLESASFSALDNSENTDNMELLETLEDQEIPLISADELFDIINTNLSDILSNDADSRSELLVEMIDTIQNNEVMYNNIIRILNQSDDPAALDMIAQLEAKLMSYEQMSQNSFASIIAKLNAIEEKINNLTLGETISASSKIPRLSIPSKLKQEIE
ncbi:MAG: hypothetical protein FWG88_03935 [Oscillospiraceae bacterium]|nr:hypothetical protein [Oscillospiraceae bacterium]